MRPALLALLLLLPACGHFGQAGARPSLHRATRLGDIEGLRQLLAGRQRKNVNARDLLGETPLLIAAEIGRSDIVAMLLEAGADASATDAKGRTATALAVEKGHVATSRLLIERRPPDFGGPAAKGLLGLAVAAGSLELVRLLLDRGVDPRPAPGEKGSLLHAVASTPRYPLIGGERQIAALLVDRGLDVNRLDVAQQSPLHNAALRGHLEIAALLLGKGANPNAGRGSAKGTPLHLAAEGAGFYSEAAGIRHLPADLMVRLLLSRGADVNATTKDGTTPLHLAAEYLQTLAVDQLIAAGAKVNARDSHGDTPLHNAHHGWGITGWGGDFKVQPKGIGMHCDPEVPRLLIARGADASARNAKGQLPADLTPSSCLEIDATAAARASAKAQGLHPELIGSLAIGTSREGVARIVGRPHFAEEKPRLIGNDVKHTSTWTYWLGGRHQLVFETVRPTLNLNMMRFLPRGEGRLIEYTRDGQRVELPTLRPESARLRFFASGDTIPPLKERTYLARFPLAATSFVNWELGLDLPPPGQRIDFSIGVVITRDSSVVATPTMCCFVLPDWKNLYCALGWGNRKPGAAWKPGRYDVQLTRGGDKLIAGSFEIF